MRRTNVFSTLQTRRGFQPPAGQATTTHPPGQISPSKTATRMAGTRK